MLDFMHPLVTKVETRKESYWEVKPGYLAIDSQDHMILGSNFMAIWDEANHKWSRSISRSIQIQDTELAKAAEDVRKAHPEDEVRVKWLRSASSRSIDEYMHYINGQMWDNYHNLDENVIFSNTETTKESYSSMSLPYPLYRGETPAYDEQFSTCFERSELDKLEWIIGAVISGKSTRIQKFGVIYGPPKSGKSTWFKLVRLLFRCSINESYCGTVDMRDLTNGATFGFESLKGNPLIAIQDDGDLSKIEDNSRLNSLVSHEPVVVNAKYSSLYVTKFNAFLVMGTNKPVKITDAKSGLLRRLIDIYPSGKTVEYRRYLELERQMEFELGAIAQKCLDKFNELGEDYYGQYVPTGMMAATNDFYDFVESNYDDFMKKNSVLLSEAWKRWHQYETDAALPYKMSMRAFRTELLNYFDKVILETRIDGKHVRNLYSGFKASKFKSRMPEEEKEENIDVQEEPEPPTWLRFTEQESVFDKEYADYPAQLAGNGGTPLMEWSKVTTRLRDIDSHEVHFVNVPENHIVVDFDKRDKDGNKDYLENWKAAAAFKPTYAELSKSGGGIHLHYIYNGDPKMLLRDLDKHVEVKVYSGNGAVRRRLTKCNNLPIATIASGLPLKKGGRGTDWLGIRNERMLKYMILKNMLKEYHANTRPSILYIYDLLEQAYESDISYDLSELKDRVMDFAKSSTNNALFCTKKVDEMHFCSKDREEVEPPEDDRITFFDCEVFPNLIVVCWKYDGADQVYHLINPSSSDIERLFKHNLIGFNNRKYDNHILYAITMGRSISEVYELSQDMIVRHQGFIPEAYNKSYSDIYDYASAAHKMSLKRFEIQLQRDGVLKVKHKELGLPWDKPVPEELWGKVVDYCKNDVLATEATHHYLEGDWEARCILAVLSGLTRNDTTNQHSTKIIFENDPEPQREFIYTDLSTIFPGYKYGWDEEKKRFCSSYRGEDPKEGGYVWAVPKMWTNVALLDIASMHPTSIEELCLFGPRYTARFSQIKQARIHIKHGEFDAVREMFDGKMAPFLNEEKAGDLSTALKTVINAVYGLTSAQFPNKFKDPRNVDNIVAKRGSLFMINLKREVEDRGYTVAHIKTDSIKIPNATPAIIQFVMDYGKKYGYTFEHEATYDKMCLVNDAVYIAKYSSPEKCREMYGYIPEKNGKAAKKNAFWTATGAQFAQPYVFKRLFSKEEITFYDLTEIKSVTTALYLDMNEDLPDDKEFVKELKRIRDRIKKRAMAVSDSVDISVLSNPDSAASGDEKERIEYLKGEIAKCHDYQFVGRIGNFIPVKKGGGLLVRKNGDSYAAAGGTIGYRWLEAEAVPSENIDIVDTTYHKSLVQKALENMEQYGNVDWFLGDDPIPLPLPEFMNIPPCEEEEILFLRTDKSELKEEHYEA